MPPYKEQGVVLRSTKLGEADKIVTVMTQGSGKVRGVAKGIRKTTSRFGGRLEPFTHVNLMLYRGRGSLDTITQAEIIAPHRAIREDLALFAAGETMLEAVDRVAEEHERNVRLVLLLLAGLRALDGGPADPAAVAESFVLKLLSISGFHPSLTACAVCGRTDVRLFSAGLGGAVCDGDAEPGSAHVSKDALAYLSALGQAELGEAGRLPAPDPRLRKESRGLLFGFTEYHLERRMKSVPMLVRTAT
jgi:DNA repair protein RecO (recombination protein O)